MTDQFLQLLATQAWQIAALAIVVAVVNRTVAKNRPHLAHALWMLVLIKCVTPPIWEHSLGLFSQLQAMWKAEPVIRQDAFSDEPLLMPHHNTNDEIALVPPADDPPLPGLIATERSDVASTLNVPITLPTKTTDSSFVPEARPWKPSWPMILLSLVASGALLTISIMVARCVLCLRHIQRHRTTEFDKSLNDQLQRLSKTLRLRRVPRIIVSDVLFGPAVIGLWRHVIVLPKCLLKAESGERKADDLSALTDRLSAVGFPLSFLDPILAHELLHIRRGDLRTGTLQAIVQSLWWFHPAVWLCNRWLSREAERCCDEQVIAELGCPPAQYARSLLSVIESKHQLQPIPVFPGMKPVEITSQRMERIMSLKSNLKKQTPLWCWLAIAALAIVVLPGAIAKPQSEENVVEAQPQEMALPQETKVADVAEVEVSSKTYIVGDLVERIAKEQNLSLDQARKSLLQIFESSVVPVHRHLQGAPAPPVNLPQPSPPADSSPGVVSIAGAVSFSFTEIAELSSYAIDGDRMVVVQSAAGHATLQEYIDAVRQHGFTTFQVTARYIIGPPEEINSLMEALQQEKPFPKAAEGETAAKSSQSETQAPQSAATLCVGTTGIVSFEESRKIEELARSKADCLSLQCPKVMAINGQVATIQVGEIKPFIVGFKENDEPMIRTVVEGLTLRVTPQVVDKGLFQLQSVACLEGTSEQRLIATTGRVTETPKMFTLPAITTKQVQTTVELQENQAFLQSGMTTTEGRNSRAFLAVLEARLIAPEVAYKAAEVNNLIREPSGVGLAEINPAHKTNMPNEVEHSANPTVKVAWEARELVRRRLLSSNDHTPWQIMSGIEGLRRDMLLKDGKKTVNSLEWIQAGPQYQGESWFEKTEHGGRAHPYSKPYWFEGHVNQFLSKLAACRLPLDATFGTPDGPITIQDMINHAKMVVNDKEEVSWTLLALCRYLPPDAKWTNAKGEEWSIERLVDIEVGKHVGGPTSPNGGTDGLYALAVARNEYLKTGKPLEGVWLKADEKIKKYIDLAKSQQNPDGTLSSDFFRSGQRKDSFDKRLSSTSHLLQFLMHAVSDEQLKEDWIRQAVETTAYDIQVHRKEFVACDPLFTATEAFTTYLERVNNTHLGGPVVSAKSAPPLLSVSNARTGDRGQAATLHTANSNTEKLSIVTYHVADLVVPKDGTLAKADFSQIVELIKATIEPTTWRDDLGKIESVDSTLSLVIRQTPKAHEQITKLLSQLRNDFAQIQISCRLMKITSNTQLKGLEERTSLHSLNKQKKWALLTEERSEGLVKFLTDEKVELLSCPRIVAFSGTTASIQIGSEEPDGRKGFYLSAEPRVVGESSVIRLRHAVSLSVNPIPEVITGQEKTSRLSSDESLIGSGQTLVLLIESPASDIVESPNAQPVVERFVVLLKVEKLHEEEEKVQKDHSSPK